MAAEPAAQCLAQSVHGAAARQRVGEHLVVEGRGVAVLRSVEHAHYRVEYAGAASETD
jgi:hypothetical protein